MCLCVTEWVERLKKILKNGFKKKKKKTSVTDRMRDGQMGSEKDSD